MNMPPIPPDPNQPAPSDDGDPSARDPHAAATPSEATPPSDATAGPGGAAMPGVATPVATTPGPAGGPFARPKSGQSWSAPPRQGPPSKPRSSLLGVLIVLFCLFGAFIGVVGGGFYLLYRAVTGTGRASLTMGDEFSFGSGKLGLIRIEEDIMPGESNDFWLDSMREMARSSSIRGIVLHIDSPGGAVGTSQELQAMVLSLRREAHKPVYVSMGDVAASGGYYIASGADQIFALKGTLTGSIGVIMSKSDVSELAKKIGVATENIKTGRFKDAGEITRPLSPDEKAMFDTLIMDTYDQFLNDILGQREERLAKAMATLPRQRWEAYKFLRPLEGATPKQYLSAIADGRAYTGQQALELGLVDQLGTLDDAIHALATRVGIRGRPKIQEAQRQRTLNEIFGSKLSFFLPKSSAPLQYRMVTP
jgi:protease-4